MASSSAMAVDAPARPKLDVDGYLARTASSSPSELQPYFEAFGTLHRRK
jgi:26S proteasome regulatory subunit N9